MPWYSPEGVESLDTQETGTGRERIDLAVTFTADPPKPGVRSELEKISEKCQESGIRECDNSCILNNSSKSTESASFQHH